MKTLGTQLTAITSCGALALCAAFVSSVRAADYSANKPVEPRANKTQTTGASDATGDHKDTMAQLSPSNSTTMAAAHSSDAKIQLATEASKDNTDRKLAGRHVRGTDNKDLGSIKDFLVDPSTGKVEFAVISSGGIGSIGDKLRLVPISALKPGTKKDEFSVSVDRAKWEQMTPLTNEAFKAEEVTIADAERRRIGESFGATSSNTSATSSVYTTSVTSSLIRASDLRGKDLRSGNREIGSVEGLVIDLNAGTATALFDAKRDFAHSNQKFLVPLHHLTFSSTKEPAVTSLTQADFESAISGNARVGSSGSGSLPTTTAADNSQVSASIDQRAAQGQSTTVAAADTTSKATSNQSSTTSQSTTASTGQSSLAASSTPAPSSTTAASPGTTTSDQALTPTGRSTANQSTTTADVTKKDSSTNVASVDTQAAISNSPPYRNEQGQDIAANAPYSPSSKSPGADKPATSTETSKSTEVASTTTTQTPSANSDLTPTGRTSADQTPAADSSLVSAAQAIRKALDADSSLAQLDVVVMPEDGKLVLSGTVTSNEQKTSVEETAKRAASGQPVASKITIGEREK